MLSTTEMLLAIGTMAVGTALTRALPFLIFPEGRKIPKIVEYLGTYLPFAIIGMLVVFCLKEVSVLQYPYGIPELIGIVFVIIMHKWRHNMLISIGGGTVFYMILVQYVF